MGEYGGKIEVLFYDVTTLHFDSDKPDKLRKTGFSKDGKHSNPQIVLGLLASNNCTNIMTSSWFQQMKCFTYLSPPYLRTKLFKEPFTRYYGTTMMTHS